LWSRRKSALPPLTPKYFATVIKRTTGIAASEWINRYVLIEAKWLLHHERGQSIQQIAYQLGFTEQASFSRFFKSYEGKTPKEYREQK
jgi:AraC-like DNA-binding protein